MCCEWAVLISDYSMALADGSDEEVFDGDLEAVLDWIIYLQHICHDIRNWSVESESTARNHNFEGTGEAWKWS